MKVNYLRSPQNKYEAVDEEIVFIHAIPDLKEFPQLEAQVRVKPKDIVSMAYDGKEIHDLAPIPRTFLEKIMFKPVKREKRFVGYEYTTKLMVNNKQVKAVTYIKKD